MPPDIDKANKEGLTKPPEISQDHSIHGEENHFQDPEDAPTQKKGKQSLKAKPLETKTLKTKTKTSKPLQKKGKGT